MNNEATTNTSAGRSAPPRPEQADHGSQGTSPPADEAIGDYADPDAIQVDGGDNSFIAEEPAKAEVSPKKSNTV